MLIITCYKNNPENKTTGKYFKKNIHFEKYIFLSEKNIIFADCKTLLNVQNKL
jgi:hypothetical protein